LRDILVEHTRIVDAIENRDAAAAQAALHEHLHHWDYLLAPQPESAAPADE
jgi:DNA-binding GntR family transcriptional regulator